LPKTTHKTKLRNRKEPYEGKEEKRTPKRKTPVPRDPKRRGVNRQQSPVKKKFFLRKNRGRGRSERRRRRGNLQEGKEEFWEGNRAVKFGREKRDFRSRDPRGGKEREVNQN